MEITSIVHHYHILPNCRVSGSNLNKINAVIFPLPATTFIHYHGLYFPTHSHDIYYFSLYIFTVIQYFSLFEGWITSYH